MRAVVYTRYGTTDELAIRDVPTPRPAAGEVLVAVAATSINLSDWEALTGSPAYARVGGLRAPRHRVLGSDIAGRVEAVGEGVTRFRPGDEVFGDTSLRRGGFAEYAAVREAALAPKPASLTFVEAAAIPQAGAIALQGTAGVSAGQRVLINGGGGGSGTFAILLAKRVGAHVTAVDNAAKLDHMRSLGADEVIDHDREDVTRGHGRFDLVLDLVAHRSVRDYHRLLAPGGRYRCVGGTTRALLRILTLGTLVGLASGRRIGVLGVREGPAHFEPLAEMCLAGEVDIHIDRVVALDGVPEALALVGGGGALGKVVVTP